jgi:hypothetical protein
MRVVSRRPVTDKARGLVLMEERMNRTEKKAIDRRNFLRTMGGASTVAVAAAASPLAASDAQAYDPGEDETKGRYRESDHVKAFYRTNGYETLQKK